MLKSYSGRARAGLRGAPEGAARDSLEALVELTIYGKP